MDVKELVRSFDGSAPEWDLDRLVQFLGGYPTWIQNPEFLACPDCGRSMCFLLQLDSELPTVEGGTFLWGTGGLCYWFRCAPCLMTGFTSQWT